MKKTLLLVVCVLFTFFSLAACAAPAQESSSGQNSGTQTAAPSNSEDADQSQDTADNEEASFVIGLSTCDGGNAVQSEMIAATEAKIEELGGKCIVADAMLDQAKQLSDVEDLIQKGVDAMIIEAVDSTAFSPALIACKEAGIPVITQNAVAPDEFKEYVTGAVYGDGYAGGYDLGKEYAKTVKEGGIILYTYNVVEICRDMADGFKDAMAEFSPDVEILLEEDAGNSTEEAMSTMESWMQAYPDMAGIFGFNSNVGIGIVAAVESAEKSDEIMITYSGGTLQDLEAIKRGAAHSCNCFPTIAMGEACAELAVKAINGEEVEDIALSFDICTQENVDEYLARYQ